MNGPQKAALATMRHRGSGLEHRHFARMTNVSQGELDDLVDNGYVSRSSGKRIEYSITDKGRRYVDKNLSKGLD